MTKIKTIELAELLLNKIESGDETYQNLADLYSLLRLIEDTDFAYAHNNNDIIKGIALRKTKVVEDVEMIRKWYDLYRRAVAFDAPHNFDDYMIYLEMDRPAAERFYLPRRRLFKQIADAMQDVDDGKLDLLGVSLPPGAGKTTIGTFFLSYLMGKYPELPNLASGHSSKLTRSMFDGVKAILDDPDYNFWEIFPYVKMEGVSAKDETINFGKAKRFKTLTCRSIEGTLTGATRCKKILYADDLVSGIEEAMSIDRMDKLWEMYVNDLRSRKLDGCAEIHVATRWSVHDPLGRLSEIHKDNPRAKFIVIPALDPVTDESNLVYEYGVGFSTEYFHDMRNIMSKVEWEALYQNNPIEREGILYPHQELNYFWELPDREPDFIISSVDVAEGGGDYTAMPVGYGYGDDVYIADAVFNNGYPEVTKPRIIQTVKKHNVERARFESNSAGGEYADSIQKTLIEQGFNNTITKKRSTSNKITRMILSSDYVKENFFFRHPDSLTGGYETDSLVNKDEYIGYMNQLTRFTVKGRNPNDDAPDSISQLYEHLLSLQGNKVEVIDRPF